MFFITMSRKSDSNKYFRTIGYFQELNDAVRVVLHNEHDLREDYYTVAAIEQISPGVHPCVQKYWYYFLQRVSLCFGR